MNDFYSTFMRKSTDKAIWLSFLWKWRRCEIHIFDSFATQEPPLPPPAPPPPWELHVGHLNESTFLAHMYDSYLVWKTNLTKHFAKILPPQGRKGAIQGILMSNLDLIYPLTGPRCEPCCKSVAIQAFVAAVTISYASFV